ncbi:hypothetical protein [Fluviicola sp.]|uniref:hypothetical protein n=1 Tax=Fluviicola sp. TaxID=1917219 RepID=UPI002616449E|nr:hypothetical protein [Fluviicola sp.]
MIYKLALLFGLCIPVFAFSGERESFPQLWIIKDSVSKSTHPDSVKLVVRVFDPNGQLLLDQHPAIIQMNIDKKTKKYTISENNTVFGRTISKGKHNIVFYLNANFESIHFDKDFAGGRYYEVGIAFQNNSTSNPRNQIMLEKPVIYLYSEKEENFGLKIKTGAALQFTYPAYNGEWKGTSSSNGTIQLNGASFPYLFWDADLQSENLRLNWHDADFIEGKQIIPYLESHLTKIGFNAKEKADFITYWGPRIQHMRYAEILWMQNKSLDEIASLEISPAFKMNRVYLIFRESNYPIDQTLQLKRTSLQPIDRSGNYLVEWGGIEVKPTL